MRAILVLFASLFYSAAISQPVRDTVSVDSLKAHVQFLASDEMEGRGPYSEGLMLSAKFIYERFLKAGLKAFPGYTSYFLPFAINDASRPFEDSTGYLYDNCLVNVIGILEGRSKPEEVIIISAHYDHVGIKGEIHNGANDNAAGVTALLALLDHYSRTGTNERSIMFCAFSGEEMGLVGSTAFANIINPERIVMMLNMDMVGVPGMGKKKFFITGEDYSGLKKIFKNNLEGYPFKLGKETNGRFLFQRSDNFPFAQLKIPAHTAMTGDDETDRCYHKPCDDIRRIDFENLEGFVKALVRAMHTIVSGLETPGRIKGKIKDAWSLY